MNSLEPTELARLLLSLAVLIGFARVLGEIARSLHQPSVLGELLAGVILGPTVFGTAMPQWQSFLFPNEGPVSLVLEGISTLSIVLFLLVAGMEVDLSIVWKQGKAAFKVGLLGTIIPFVIGLGFAAAIPQHLGRQVDADALIFVLFLATAMAISALPVIAKTLMDLDLYRTDLGMVVISAAIFNDIIGWTVFALILGMMGSHATGFGIGMTLFLTLVFVALVLTVGRWLIHVVLPVLQAHTHYPGGVLGFAVSIGLLGAAFTEWVGIHAIFGAFLVGVALGDSKHLQERTRVMIDEFVSFIFAPLFFASIGLKVNFVTHFDVRLVLLILALSCCGKIAGAVLGARWGGFDIREQWAIGFAMNARGAMEIILGTLALEAGVIRQRLFVALVVMAISTSAISGPLMRRILKVQQPLNIRSFLSPKLYIRNLQAETRLHAIRELAQIAGQEAGIDPQKIESLAWEREQVAATGIGNGVAIPHARVQGLKNAVLAVGISNGGVEFDAPDGQPAHIVFLLVTPAGDAAIQLELYSHISKMCREPRNVERLCRAASFTEFLAVVKTSE